MEHYMPSEGDVAAAQHFDERRRCRMCGMQFRSRTRLFEHLRTAGHESDVLSPDLLTNRRLGYLS